MKLKIIIPLLFTIHSVIIKAQAQQAMDDGKLIFEKKCTRCHGYDGTKGYLGAKNLRKSRLDDDGLFTTITNGRWIMPSWKRKLSPQQIHAVIALYQNFKKLIMTIKKMNELILLCTAIATALIAGLFYAYTCSVNIGLGRLPDRDYLAAMQAINSAILNPLFFASFMGTLLLLPLSAWLNFSDETRLRFTLLCAAAVLYMVGVFGVTIFGNVPLNDALAHIDLSKLSSTEIAGQRAAFEKPWLTYHNIRTAASVICLVLVILSCMYKKMPA